MVCHRLKKVTEHCPRVKDQILVLYKTAHKIIVVLYILIFKVLNTKFDDNRFWSKWYYAFLECHLFLICPWIPYLFVTVIPIYLNFRSLQCFHQSTCNLKNHPTLDTLLIINNHMPLLQVFFYKLLELCHIFIEFINYLYIMTFPAFWQHCIHTHLVFFVYLVYSSNRACVWYFSCI